MALRELLPATVSQKQIADALGVSRPLVSRWMSGAMDVPSRHIEALAKILGAPVGEIVRHGVAHPTGFAEKAASEAA